MLFRSNDSLDHQAGDQLLVGASARMKDLLRDVDTLARLGGDEFIIVLGGPLSPDSVTAVAVRLVESLQQPYYLNGITAHSGASVGVALFPDDGLDAETLVRHADMAMYAAKRDGRGDLFIRDGKFVRWWDYWDLGALMNHAPAWWVEHIMAESARIGLRSDDAPAADS